MYKYEPEGQEPFVANSNHFGGEPNVLASARTVDRKTPDGKKILHVEEIQSDWHQQGREKGYKQETKPRTLEVRQSQDGNFGVFDLDKNAFVSAHLTQDAAEKYLQRTLSERPTSVQGVPDAPFKKNWEEMVSKDLIKHAIDNGYDGIALTNGKDQADRYSLANNIDALHYNPDTHRLIGKPRNSALIDEVAVPPEKLESYIGKETAQKVMSQEPNVNGLRSLLGEDLQIGGEGMKGFYDKKMPNIFNDIGKPYGAEMQLNSLPVLTPKNSNLSISDMLRQTNTPEQTWLDMPIEHKQQMMDDFATAQTNNKTPLHYMEFTPEMKQGVATEGLPAYADGGQVAQPRHEAFLNPSIRLANGSVTLNPLEFMPNYQKGGKVHVSDDIDMMRHEIHMSGGGSLTNAVLKKVNQFLTKAEKVPALPLNIPRATPKTNQEIDKVATRVSKQMLGEHVKPENSTKTVNLANRSMKENERVKSLPYQIQPTGASQKAEAYEPKIGDVNIAVPGDQTISDSILLHVGDLEDINSVQEGGGRYGLGKMGLENPLFWASGEDPAQMAQDKITRLAGYYSPDRVIGQHMAMGPISNNFAMHLADANLKSTAMHIADGKINPEQMYSFDNIIANGYVKKNAKTGEYEHINFPHWPGIADLEGSYKAMQNDPELRKWYNNRMKTPDVTSAHGLPNGLDIQWAITEPALRNMEVNLTGLSAGKMVPGAELTDTASHNTYAKGIQGLALQPKTPPGAFEILYPDATQYIRETKNPSDFTGTIQKVFPHQLVDDQYLNEVGQYNDFIKKYTGQKKGGTVHMGAGGSLVDIVAKKLGQFALPIAEREANKAKFLEPSEVKDVLYHGTGADIKQFIPSLKTNSTFFIS